MAEPALSVVSETTEADRKQKADDAYIVSFINSCFSEAEEARRDRMDKNRVNRELYMGDQDWSHKIAGQSRTFLPKIANACEQMSAFIKKGLIQFGDWFSVDVSPVLSESPLQIEGHHIRGMLKHWLDNLKAPDGDTYKSFAVNLSDGVKMATLESLLVFKVHGGICTKRNFAIERGRLFLDQQGKPETVSEDRLVSQELHYWKPQVDLLATDDYYPDPTGRNLYEIHEVYRDYHDVLQDAEDGLYDLAQVQSLEGRGVDDKDTRNQKRRERERGHNNIKSGFRKPLRLREFWGTILDAKGNRLHRNIVATIAQDSVLIRRPEPNPFWHQESPFVAAPLIRVPHSVWHKALYDDASKLNIDLNEVFSLMVDGGLAAVWGTRQIRIDCLEDPTQAEGGIPQGTTLAVTDQLPHGEKVMETVTTGQMPQEAAMMYEALSREFSGAALTNELKMGSLPPRTVKATEIVQQEQSQNITLDGIVSDVEKEIIERVLRKTWLNCLQFLDDMDPKDVLASGNPRAANTLLRLRPPQRFTLFAQACTFRVSGLSATLARARDFQRVMAALQVFGGNPMLAQAFLRRFLPDKFIDYAFKCLNIDPDSFTRDKWEQASFEEEMRATQAMSTAMGGGSNAQGTPASSPAPGEENLPAEINQMGNPLSGM